MKDQFVGLVVRGRAIVARHRYIHPGWNQRAPEPVEPLHHAGGHGYRVGAGALGHGQADGRGHRPLPPAIPGPAPRPRLVLRRGLFDPCHVGQQHGRARGRPHGQRGQLLRIRQCLPGDDQRGLSVLAHGPGRKGAVGLADRLDQIAERDTVERKPGRIGHDAQRHALPAGDEGQAHVIDLGDLGAQLARQFGEGLIVPLACRARPGRERQHHDRHVVDAADRHLRRRDAHRNAVAVGLDLLVDADRRVLGVGPHQEARGDHDAVVLRLGVDMLHPVHALDDRLEWLGHQLHRLRRRQTRRRHHDVDHGDLDLRLFLARDRDRGDQPDDHRGQQEQRGQRRLDRRAGQPARKSEGHRPVPISTSPAAAPERSSTLPGSAAGAVCTGTCVVLPPFATTVT